MPNLKASGGTNRTGTFILLACLCFSCTTPIKELIYFNGLPTGQIQRHGPEPEAYRIRPGDLLYVSLTGDDITSSSFLDLAPNISYVSSGLSIDLITYVVDESGSVNFPKIGRKTVGGLTVNEISDLVQKSVDEWMEGLSVSVKLVNRTITVLGEVRRPGQHQMVQNRMTIFEALGMAGDISEYGDRREVKLIRDLPSGKLFAAIDLTDPGLINTEYYYVLPHDLIYVEPSSRVYGNKTMPFGTGFSILFSTISTTLLLLNFLK